MRVVILLSVLLLTMWSDVVAASPTQQCKSFNGMTVCGYNCVANYGQVRCAQTPQGSCAATATGVVCSDEPKAGFVTGYPGYVPGSRRVGLPASLQRGVWPASTCTSAFGKSACGYDCQAGYGDLKCAKTPFGACLSAFGQVECFDPSPGLIAEIRDRDVATRARCVAAFGEIACGYGCQSAFGQVRCSSVPGGVCTTSYGKITCFGDAADGDTPR